MTEVMLKKEADAYIQLNPEYKYIFQFYFLSLYFARNGLKTLNWDSLCTRYQKFISCKTCAHSRGSKPKEFWVKAIITAHIQSRASQKVWNNNVLSSLAKYHMIKGKVGGRKFVDKPYIHGQPFCWTHCFPTLHACAYDKMVALRGQAERGNDHWDHKGKGKLGIRKSKGIFAVEWIRKLQNDYGEYQPTNSKKIELPPDTKANLFVSYVVDMEKKSNPKVSFHHFLKIWNTDFSRLILPKNCRLVIFQIKHLTFVILGKMQNLWKI